MSAENTLTPEALQATAEKLRDDAEDLLARLVTFKHSLTHSKKHAPLLIHTNNAQLNLLQVRIEFKDLVKEATPPPPPADLFRGYRSPAHAIANDHS